MDVAEAKSNFKEALAAHKKAAVAESKAHDAAKEAGGKLHKTRRARIETARVSKTAERDLASMLSKKELGEFIKMALGVPDKKKPEDQK